MSNHDAAFLWESAALRARRNPPAPPSIPLRPGWATLRQAHQETGVPINTLRKWGRQGSVPSMVVETEAGLRRLVRLESVIARAEHQGREVPGNASAADAPRRPHSEPERTTEEEAESAVPPPAGTGAAPEGSMIVPIAAWDRLLMQLGNLHEAGQQLAEARERAARAETEAAFLRERLAELRRDDGEATGAAPRQGSAKPPPPAVSDPAGANETVWAYARRRWRRWRND